MSFHRRPSGKLVRCPFDWLLIGVLDRKTVSDRERKSLLANRHVLGRKHWQDVDRRLCHTWRTADVHEGYVVETQPSAEPLGVPACSKDVVHAVVSWQRDQCV